MEDKQQQGAGGQPQAGGQAKDAPELPNVELHIVEMSNAERDLAVDLAKRGVVSLFRNERRSFCEVAKFIKQEFERQFHGAWHVFVGKHFGAWITHEAQKLVYFHIGQAAFLIYRHG